MRPDAPCLFDTDVNAPAVAEHARMCAEASRASRPEPTSCAYITVGTGIGVGLVINGAPVHGLVHPEGGHLAVPVHASDAASGFAGVHAGDAAVFGGCAAESMACSAALAKRANLASTSDLKDLPDDHPVW